MEEQKNYALEIIIKNLEALSNSIEKLSGFTNEELAKIKIDVSMVIEDIRHLKVKCNPDTIREVIEGVRLKLLIKKPRQLTQYIVWLVAIFNGLLAIYLFFKG